MSVSEGVWVSERQCGVTMSDADMFLPVSVLVFFCFFLQKGSACIYHGIHRGILPIPRCQSAASLIHPIIEDEWSSGLFCALCGM